MLVLGVSISAVVAGFFVGNAISFSLRKKPNYNFDVSAYTESISDLAYSQKDLPTDRVGTDAFIIASHLLSCKKYYNISGSGVVETGFGNIGSLYIWGNAKKENGTIHTSLVTYNKMMKKYQVGLMYDFDIANDKLVFYYGTGHSDGSATWKEPETLTSAEYKKEWGLSPDSFFTYTISSKTATTNEKPKTKILNGEKLYEYKIILDNELAVSNYAKQIKKMSELDNYPVFSLIEFSFVVNDAFEIKSVSIHERYSVYLYGMLANCDGNLSYTFEY